MNPDQFNHAPHVPHVPHAPPPTPSRPQHTPHVPHVHLKPCQMTQEAQLMTLEGAKGLSPFGLEQRRLGPRSMVCVSVKQTLVGVTIVRRNFCVIVRQKANVRLTF